MKRSIRTQIKVAHKILTNICKYLIDLYNFNLLTLYLLGVSIQILLLKYCNFTFLTITFLIYNLVFTVILYIKKKQLHKKLSRNLEYWWSLDGWSFEKEVAKVLKKNGYNKVKVTKGSRDGGVDIIFYRGTAKYIAQCKHYKVPVGPEPVRALWGVKDDFNADVVVMIASSGLTRASEQFISNKKGYLMWTLKDIIEMSLR